MSWNAKMVIQMAGIPLEDADAWLVQLAESCVERCYYLDRAARDLVRILNGPRW